jgi:sugar lactone lactonase YvrE
MRKLIGFVLLSLFAACSLLPNLSESVKGQAAAPPLLRRIKPPTITTGAPTFTIRLEGKDFVAGAQVLVNGAPLASSRVNFNGRILLAEIDESLVAAPGTHTITAMNPDGQTSANVTLTVVDPDPELDIQLFGNAIEEDFPADQATDILGEGFQTRSTALFWGVESPMTNFISDNAIEFVIPAALLEEPARIPVLVRNRGGVLSNVDIFFVVPRPAAIDTIEPFEVTVGAEEFDLMVFGTNFKDDATIVVNGQPLPTTHPRPQRLETKVPAALRAEPSQLVVRVEQEGIQSADVTLAVTPTEDPFIYTIAPVVVRVGERREQIELVGANFRGEMLEATIDGEAATIASQTRRRVVLAVRGALLDSPGVHQVQIKNTAGNLSNTTTFEVVPDSSVETAAGGFLDGFNTACVPTETARLRRPSRMAFGPDGLLYFADQQNHAIRSLNLETGEVCTIAGTGLFGYNDSGNSREFAPAFSNPLGIAVAGDGTIFVTENGNNVVRRIVRGPDGVTVDTIAGARELLTDRDRQDRFQSTLRGLEGFRDGPGDEAKFRRPDGIVLAGDGSLYVTDAANHSIRRITINGPDVMVETIAGNGVPGFADGEATKSRFRGPTGLALSADGQTLFVADMNNHRIRGIDLVARKVTTVAGIGELGARDGPPAEASFNLPIGLTVGSDGTLYVVEFGGNLVRRIDSEGNVTTLSGGSRVKFRDGTGILATFRNPRGITIDPTGQLLFVADYENFRLREIALP